MTLRCNHAERVTRIGKNAWTSVGVTGGLVCLFTALGAGVEFMTHGPSAFAGFPRELPPLVALPLALLALIWPCIAVKTLWGLAGVARCAWRDSKHLARSGYRPPRLPPQGGSRER